jgi:hypothetical protein
LILQWGYNLNILTDIDLLTEIIKYPDYVSLKNLFKINKQLETISRDNNFWATSLVTKFRKPNKNIYTHFLTPSKNIYYKKYIVI